MYVNLSLHFHDAFVPVAAARRGALSLPFLPSSVASPGPARPHAVTRGSAAACRANRRSEVGETEARELMWGTISPDKMVLEGTYINFQPLILKVIKMKAYAL